MLRAGTLAAQTKAASIVEYETQEQFFKILPDLFEKAVQHPPNIEQLRVMKMEGNDNSGLAGIASPVWQVGSTLAYLREFLRFFDDREPSLGAKPKPDDTRRTDLQPKTARQNAVAHGNSSQPLKVG